MKNISSAHLHSEHRCTITHVHWQGPRDINLVWCIGLYLRTNTDNCCVKYLGILRLKRPWCLHAAVWIMRDTVFSEVCTACLCNDTHINRSHSRVRRGMSNTDGMAHCDSQGLASPGESPGPSVSLLPVSGSQPPHSPTLLRGACSDLQAPATS